MARIIPFWHRIPSVFGYGLRPAPIGVAALAAFVAWAAQFLIWPFLIALVVWAVILKYSFHVLERSSEGDCKPPTLADGLSGDSHMPLKLLGILILFVLLLEPLASLGAVAFWSGQVLGAALLPASLVLLGVTGSFVRALNPVLLFGFVLRIGAAYWLLFIFVQLLMTGYSTLSGFIGSALSPAVSPLFTVALATYFSIVIFHLLGYVAYQYHERLSGSAPEAVRAAEQAPEVSRYSDFERFMAEGNKDAAIAELEGVIASNPDDLEPYKKLNTLLIVEQRTDRLARHTDAYVSALLNCGRAPQTAQVVENTMRLLPDYRPRRAPLYEPVMAALRMANKPKLAVALANGFHKRCRNADVVPRVYLQAARIYCEDLQREDLAERLLRFLRKNYPDHPLDAEIADYLRVVAGAAP